MLSAYNIKVTKAVSGKEALEKITSMNYDFVFMDHMMPEMDGVECFHRIRQKSGTYYRNVPIIALTANAVAGTREMLLKEGFDDFLEKPIERSVLERILKRNLTADKIIEKKIRVEEEERTVEKTVTVKKVEGSWLEQLEDYGLDVKKAILYCNGEEAYYKILQGYLEEGKKLEKQLTDLFTIQDWKNYTIVVHGIKSAMHSIGAISLSELAKKLEMAGKSSDINYILENHEEMMNVYRELFIWLSDSEIFSKALNLVTKPKEEVKTQAVEITEELWELDDEDFDQILEKLEESIYELNSRHMLEITEELKECSYRGKALKEIIVMAQRKIEMSDYLSAVDMIAEWKEENRR